jgi:hypothetical protein
MAQGRPGGSVSIRPAGAAIAAETVAARRLASSAQVISESGKRADAPSALPGPRRPH